MSASPSTAAKSITSSTSRRPASPVDYLKHGIETLRVGSLGSMNCLELARKYNAKFLLASTSECYGDPLEHPQKEATGDM